jgi:hypothetical protein
LTGFEGNIDGYSGQRFQQGFFKNKPLLYNTLEDGRFRWFTKTDISRQGRQTHGGSDYERWRGWVSFWDGY